MQYNSVLDEEAERENREFLEGDNLKHNHSVEDTSVSVQNSQQR